MTARPHATYKLTKPVYFIGFMGAGKTSVSQQVAETCGLIVVDADEYLEQAESRTIASIFAEEGEEHFRDLETQYLCELAALPPRFISCGGGVVKRQENVRIMQQTGFVVCLSVTAEGAAERIPNTESRPLFKNLDVARSTLAERAPLYDAAANAVVNTTGRPVPEIAEEVRDILLEAGVLSECE